MGIVFTSQIKIQDSIGFTTVLDNSSVYDVSKIIIGVSGESRMVLKHLRVIVCCPSKYSNSLSKQGWGIL